MDTNNKLMAEIAKLQTQVDLLDAELSYLNTILTNCGFSEGIKTLKATVEELLLEEMPSHRNL